MKTIISTFILVFLLSCDSPQEIRNKQVKSSIHKKGAEIRENYSQYRNDITNSKFTSLLNFDRLKNDNNLQESKKIIGKAESIFKTFNKNNEILVSDLTNLLDSIDKSERTSHKEIERLKSKFEKTFQIIKENYKLDSTVLSLNKKILDLLSKCKYVIKDGQPEFESMDCVFEYNKRIMELNQITIESKINNLKNKVN